MSAFVVSDEHLSLLVDALMDGPGDVPIRPDMSWDCRWTLPEDDQTPGPDAGWERRMADHQRRTRHPRQIGTADLYLMLWRENVRSVAYRYSEPEMEYEPGRYKRLPYRMTPVETLHAIACYEYQSCETPDWTTTEAAAALRALEAATIRRLPGYNAAPWEWTERDIAARMSGHRVTPER